MKSYFYDVYFHLHSCCVDLIAAAHVPSDGLIHFDDACLSNLESPKIPLLFVFPKIDINYEALKKCMQEELKQHQYSLVVYDCICSHLLGNILLIKVNLLQRVLILNIFLDSAELIAESEKVILSKLVTGETANFAHTASKGLCGLNCHMQTAGLLK